MTHESAAKGNATLKGLVLAGGKGSRLRPLTATGAKQLVPIANKPVLFYAIEQMVEAGITDIGIITGDTAAQVKEALGDGSAFGARFTFIHQPAPLGLAHAVLTAAPFLGDARFCMYLGDNFIQHGIRDYVECYRQGDAAAHILLKQVKNPASLGVAVVDDDGHVRELVEKPAIPVSDLAVIGLYFFGPEVHGIARNLEPSARGELEITDAIQGLIDAGHTVDATIIDDEWIDTGKKDDMLEANRLVLGMVTRRIDGQLDPTSTVVGEVVIGEGACIVNSSIRGPVVIGCATRIENAFIGPFTAIGDRCEITNCEIEHSIVMDDSILRNVQPRISDSLIGREVVVERREEAPRTAKLLLGDHAQIRLP